MNYTWSNFTTSMTTTAVQTASSNARASMFGLKRQLPVAVLMTLAYILVFIFAIGNNYLVVSVIYRNKQMRTVTNIFIANLAVADIIVSMLVPPATLLSNLFTPWYLGGFLCKVIPYLQATAVSSSVNTLAVTAVERYLAIVRPHLNLITPERAVKIIAIIWIIPLFVQSPWAYYYVHLLFTREPYPVYICYPKFPSFDVERQFFFIAAFLACYVMPLFFLSFFYSLIGIKVWRRNVSGIRGSKAERSINRSKIRIVRMLATVTLFFAVSWLPLYCIRLAVLFGNRKPSQVATRLRNIAMPIAQWFGSANSCVNPLIYCYFSVSFRQNIMAILRSRKFRGPIELTSARNGVLSSKLTERRQSTLPMSNTNNVQDR